jgi:hypothetical protein
MATYTDPTTIISAGKPNMVLPGSVLVLLAGFLAILGAGGLYWQGMNVANQVTTTKAQAAATKAEADKLKSTAAQLEQLTRTARDLHIVFDTQKRWENVLDKMAERFHQNLVVTAIQLTDKGTVTLSGTVPDYFTYAKVFQAFTDKDGLTYFSTVRPTAVTRVATTGNSSYISFSFVITLQPSVLNAGSYAEAKTK